MGHYNCSDDTIKAVSVCKFKIWLERNFISTTAMAVKERLPRTYKTQKAFHNGWLPPMKFIFCRDDDVTDASML